LKLFSVLKWFGRSFHRVAAANINDFLPYLVDDDYTSSYINLLEKALVPSLQIRRIRTMTLETYKIVNKLAPVCLHDLVNVKNSKYAFRYSNILDVPQVRTTRYGKKSLMFAAATLWVANAT
jgi:hypothetical protein